MPHSSWKPVASRSHAQRLAAHYAATGGYVDTQQFDTIARAVKATLSVHVERCGEPTSFAWMTFPARGGRVAVDFPYFNDSAQLERDVAVLVSGNVSDADLDIILGRLLAEMPEIPQPRYFVATDIAA